MFAVNTNGTGFTNLHSFTAEVDDGQDYTNTDGAIPYAGLILSGSTLYGTAGEGGSSGNGTVFAVSSDGTGFTNLHSFTAVPPFTFINSDGARPQQGELFLSGNTLYGTARIGGSAGNGTVFAVNTNGTGFTNLHSFAATTGSFPISTNSDGVYPQTRVILSGSTLYGTAGRGGSAAHGTVFAMNIDGTGFTNLHSFIGSDGAGPGGLILWGNILYGAAAVGTSGSGTVFKLNTNGTGFTNLYSFTATSGSGGPNGTNSDGTTPSAGLILSGNTLYGTAQYGGGSGWGTVFAVNTDGTGFTNLHSFTAPDSITGTNLDGAEPEAALILSHNTLYGTTYLGGSGGKGTVFSISLPSPPPQLAIIRSAANVILTWQTNYADFKLQSTTNLISPVWTTNLPTPVVVNGQNTVTNPISGTRMFYRLSQ